MSGAPTIANDATSRAGPWRVGHKQVPLAPAVLLALAGVGVMLGAIFGRVKGAIGGAVAGAAVGAWAFFSPQKAVNLFARFTSVTSNLKDRAPGTHAFVQWATGQADTYRRFVNRFPDDAGKKVEEKLRASSLLDKDSYYMGLTREAVTDTINTHLGGRILLEGVGGGVSWVLFRRREKLGQRLRDFGVGFIGGVMLEFPYHAFNQYVKDIMDALLKQRSITPPKTVRELVPLLDRPLVINLGERVDVAVKKLQRKRVDQMPVVDDDGICVGMLHVTDIAAAKIKGLSDEDPIGTKEDRSIISQLRGVVTADAHLSDLLPIFEQGMVAVFLDEAGRVSRIITPQDLNNVFVPRRAESPPPVATGTPAEAT